MSAGNAHVVLVHGAWADGSSWSKVIGPLTAQGLGVHGAPLPLASLGDDVLAIQRYIDRIDDPVVLVGHAYAGAVIGSVREEKVKALVYIAALAPDEGETVADVFYRAEPHPKAPKLVPDRNGWIWLPEEAFGEAFAQDATPEEIAVLAAVQRPISAECIGVAVKRPLWKDRPSWFLVAGRDRMISAETQRFMATRMNAISHSLDADHTPPVTAPNAVVDVVLDAARNVRSRRRL